MIAVSALECLRVVTEIVDQGVGGFAGVGVRAGVDQPVPVRGASADVPVGGLGHRGHGGADPGLDPGPLALADGPERRHDHVVGLVGRVDRPADLRHPQRHAVMLEQREGVAELVTVERPLWLTDDHRVKPSVWVGQFLQQAAGFGAPGRWDGPGLVDVEELGDDHATARGDELLGTGVLPGAGGFGVLAVFGGTASPER
nr:hypothetical protein [Actinomadura syzygii]